jgi:hypothetical protein
MGEFHDQGDAKRIVIRRQLRGHIDTPFGRPVPGRPIWWFKLLLLVIFFFNIVPLIVKFTYDLENKRSGENSKIEKTS